MDIIDQVLAKNYANDLLAAVQSGFDHAETIKNADGSVTMIMYFTNGTSVSLDFDKPEDGLSVKSMEIRVIDAENHLICILEDDSEIDAGVMPTPTKVTHEEIFITPTDTWIIQHNLRERWNRLDIKCFGINGGLLIGEVDTTVSTENLIVIKFDAPMDGRVIIKKQGGF